MNDDYAVDDEYRCPHCKHVGIHHRHCDVCEDGYISHYEEDPLWYNEDDCELCPECHGYGVQQWCPVCGKDPRLGGAANESL